VLMKFQVLTMVKKNKETNAEIIIKLLLKL